MTDQPDRTTSSSAARKPDFLWWLEVKRSPLLVIAYANAINGSVVYKTFYTLTKRGARRRAERWLRTTRKGNR